MSSILVFIITLILFSLSAFLFPIDLIWYSKLKKPEWTPPNKLFGIVWGILYILIALSLAIVDYKVGLKNTSFFYLLIWLINYLSNQAFSYFQFKLKRLDLAAIDCLIVAITALLLVKLTLNYSILASVLLIPYALWAIFATYLSFTIYRLNK
ncbi:TspO/MBR family protein [Gottfriedia luciferensis]|uniref:TspO/MBR family protein n=1 Tax=Gottfriedia luciferensis TaxID=178774 RepID=UPI000B44D54F|nr:tryptophan-rich sensory protein [Gottfriedia luciferensis]